MIEIISEFVKLWLKEIVVLFIVISLIDLIMPKGKMKRYVDFIIGILIIFTIISPLTQFNNIKLDLDSALNEFDDQAIQDNPLSNLQNKQVEAIYTNNLKVKIHEIIEDNISYRVKDIELITLPDDERIFVLEKINIVLTKQKEKKQTIKVEKVEFGKKAIETANINTNAELVELIASAVQIEHQKINITMEGEEN